MIAVLALLTAVVGGASALMSVLGARLSVDTRGAWLGTAVACAVVLVLGESGLAATSPGLVLRTVELLVPGLVVAFLLVALVHPAAIGGRQIATAASGALLLVVAGAMAAVLRVPAQSALSSLGLSYAWSALALAVAVVALRRRERALGALAAGVALLGAVHLADLVGRGPLDAASPVVPSLRLGAVGLVLAGSIRLIWRALVRLDTQRDTQEEELRLAAARLERAAERDHELRTGLAGLAGAARLLEGGGADGGARARTVGGTPLDALMASEIRRLEGLLRLPVGLANESRTIIYDVESVLRGLVALRRASGTDIRLEADAALRAIGSPNTLASVMTNVFANAERHAPGSPVRVTAMRWNDRVVVRVRDFGPGVEPGRERMMLERGVRDAEHGGSGLGLHVCRRMLAPEHGSIAVSPRERTGRGCSVVVDLPAAEALRPAAPSSDPKPEPCAVP